MNTQIKGEILYRGSNLLENTEAQFNKIRGNDIGMIFQDPLGSLNPLMTVQDQISETLLYHSDMNKVQRVARVEELLTQVQIPNPKRVMKQYPHELSGGMRQMVYTHVMLPLTLRVGQLKRMINSWQTLQVLKPLMKNSNVIPLLNGKNTSLRKHLLFQHCSVKKLCLSIIV